MGFLVRISPECLDGRTKSYAIIIIDCYDPGLIPTRIYVGHDGLWTHCSVQLVGRDIPHAPNFGQPPPGDEGWNSGQGGGGGG